MKMTNHLRYLAYGVRSIPSERLLKEMVKTLRKELNKAKIGSVGIRYKIANLDKLKGTSAALVIAYFPKFSKDNRSEEEVLRGYLENIVNKVFVVYGGEFDNYGLPETREYVPLSFDILRYEVDKEKSVDRFIIEQSSDVMHRFKINLGVRIERYFEKKSEFMMPVIAEVEGFGDRVSLTPLFPRELMVDLKVKVGEGTRDVIQKRMDDWYDNVFRKIQTDDEIQNDLEDIFINTRKGMEKTLRLGNEKREKYESVYLSIDTTDPKLIKSFTDYLESDNLSRVRGVEVSVKEPELVAPFNYIKEPKTNFVIHVTHPYTTHKKDNVKHAFREYALTFVKDCIQDCFKVQPGDTQYTYQVYNI